jgi:chromate transporter
MITKDTPTIKQTYTQIFFRFLKFGFLAWGGPVAQIAMLREELVEEEKWISREKFNRALSVYQVLPGPEAHEMCVYFGMLAGGRWGGFLAGLAFMLPGFLLMLLLTFFYITIGIKSTLFQYVFMGFQVAVIALIISAVHRIGKHVLINKQLLLIAVGSLVGHFCGLPFYVILLFAGIAYVLWRQGKWILTALIGIGLIIACFYLVTPDTLKIQNLAAQNIEIVTPAGASPLKIFFTGLKGGLLTFGGAYTVIPFIQQDAVTNSGWLTNHQFLDGIALSGILPAPLIIFSTFVGYFGGGWTGAFLITIGIFLPAFSFTLLGHGLMEKLIENKSLHNFLDGITAGVIGLIALTSFQLFRTTITDLFSIVLFSLCLVTLLRIKSKLTAVFVLFSAGILSLTYFNCYQ